MTDFQGLTADVFQAGGHFFAEDFSSFDSLDLNKNSADSFA
jgi:hypothetical protein